MSFFSKLIELFGEWFSFLKKNQTKLYEQLAEKEKIAANKAYGIIDLVNRYGTDALGYVRLFYPEVSANILQGYLAKLLSAVHAVDDNVPLTLEDVLKDAQAYLNKHTGSVWVQIIQGTGNILSELFSPDTPIQKFINVAEYVYQQYIKPKSADIDTDFFGTIVKQGVIVDGDLTKFSEDGLVSLKSAVLGDVATNGVTKPAPCNGQSGCGVCVNGIWYPCA